MPNIRIGRYSDPEGTGFRAWIDCGKYMLFVGLDGRPVVWLKGDFS